MNAGSLSIINWQIIHPRLTSASRLFTTNSERVNLRLVGLIADAVVVHLAKELNAEDAVERHEEQEEDCDIVDLLAWTSGHTFIQPLLPVGQNGHHGWEPRADADDRVRPQEVMQLALVAQGGQVSAKAHVKFFCCSISRAVSTYSSALLVKSTCIQKFTVALVSRQITQ